MSALERTLPQKRLCKWGLKPVNGMPTSNNPLLIFESQDNVQIHSVTATRCPMLNDHGLFKTVTDVPSLKLMYHPNLQHLGRAFILIKCVIDKRSEISNEMLRNQPFFGILNFLGTYQVELRLPFSRSLAVIFKYVNANVSCISHLAETKEQF